MTHAATRHSGEPPISAEQVEHYLFEHPDFFADHLELLESLNLPHPSGNAISLLSKQVELLREKNQKLEKQLDQLVLIARDNDDLCRRMHLLTLALVDAPTLEETLAGLERVLHECFLADFVAVRIFQPHQETALSHVFIPPDHPDLAAFQNLLQSNRPKCGHPTHSQARFLFGDFANEALSCALVPIHSGAVRLLLAIGSRDPDRFHPSMGHLFLTQIGELLGARLDALLNRDPRS